MKALILGIVAVLLAEAEGEQLRFKIMTKKLDDTVEVQAGKDRVAFIVNSQSGISQAVIERQEDKWPKVVVLLLNLKGLESIQVSNDSVRLDAAVSSQTGMVRLWKDGNEEAPVDKNSPFWTEIRMLGRDGKPATQKPLRDGYFEVVLPRAFFEGSPKSITVRWIDFYR